MRTQHILIYGLNRSPTLANFQKIPAKLFRMSVFRLSFRYGAGGGE